MDEAQLTVDTPSGRLTGLKRGNISVFLGIPYATPPVGALRWRLTEPLAPWAGTRDATRPGAASLQAPAAVDRLTGSSIGAIAEDCLYLNVWTPSLTGKRPVMVWLHGGAFVFGAGHQAIYDGTRLALRDCVVVTINYRLGALGFLACEEIGAGGAQGIADQVMALRWVKDNIASFGGDPGNVTLFGESAGAMSASILLASPLARGLFHKMIAQSGAAHIGQGPERAERVTHGLLEKLGTSDPRALLDAPAASILAAQTALMFEIRTGRRKLGGLPFQPALGNALLPVRPIEALREGAGSGVALLTGTTMEEWKLFTAIVPSLRFMTAANFAARAARLAGDAGAAALLAAYREGSPFARFNAMMTDKAFMVPATRILEAQAPHAYAYRFDWRSRLLGGLFGACHALELGFVFGTYEDGRGGSFFGKGPPAAALSTAMMDCWAAFAHTGDPGWPRYDRQSRQTMIFGDGEPHVVSAPEETRRQAWDDVAEARLGP